MINNADVKNWIKISSADDVILTVAVAAANVFVESLPNIDRKEDGSWAETTHLGALLLAAKLYRRTNSANGIESFGEGGAVYVARYDSDISRMLHIDGFQKPMVG